MAGVLGNSPHVRDVNTSAATIALLLWYLFLVQYLRFRSVRGLEMKYASLLNEPYTMSYKTAQEIMQHNLLYEMPYINLLAG
jgi:hypothetical protein